MGKRNGAFLWIKEENGREKPLVSLPFGGDEPVGLRFVVLCKGLCRIGRMLLSALPRGESGMPDSASRMCAFFSSVFCAVSLRGTQCVAIADAALCDGQCSALRWPVQRAPFFGPVRRVVPGTRLGRTAGQFLRMRGTCNRASQGFVDRLAVGRLSGCEDVQSCSMQGVGVLVLFPLGWSAYGLLAFGLNCSMVMRSTFTSSSGRSFLSVFTPCMAPTTSSPSMTSPNTVYCPSRCGVPPRIS